MIRVREKCLLVVLISSLIVAHVTLLRAATYFVSPAGKNSWTGTEEKPWRTLQYAAERVVPGDLVLVADGVYKPFHITRSGTPKARIEFRANGSRVQIDGHESYDDRFAAISVLASFVTVDGFKIDVGAKDSKMRSRGVRVSGTGNSNVYGVIIRNNSVTNAGWVGITTSYAEGVVIENNEVSHSRGQHGIYVANSADRPMVRKNKCFENAQAGIQINADPELAREYGGDGIISGAIVEGNVLFNNGREGSAALNLASIRDSVIRNNLLYENKAGGIANWDDEAGVRYGCKNNKYFNNTVIQPSGARHALSFRHGSTGNMVKNNVLIHLGGKDGIAVDVSSMEGLESDYNLLDRVETPGGEIVQLNYWQEVWGHDLHSISAPIEELFHDWSSHDFRLRPGSPAIDAGTRLADVTEDLEGNDRPQGKRCDIGAYEWKGAKHSKQDSQWLEQKLTVRVERRRIH